MMPTSLPLPGAFVNPVPDQGALWRALCTEGLRWKLWDGEDRAVVFDGRSGHTHLLGLESLAVLLALAAAPEAQSCADLLGQLQHSTDDAEGIDQASLPAEQHGTVLDHLRALASLDLAQRIQTCSDSPR